MGITFLDRLKDRTTRFPANFLLLTVIALVYFFSGTFGLSFYIAEGAATLVWPPTGLSIAAIMLFGFRVWPAIAIGSLLVNIYNTLPIPIALCVMIGNTIEALAAVFLLNLFSKDTYFSTMQSSLAFGSACFLATSISASIGVASLFLGGEIQSASLINIWLIWWLGDLLGAFVFATLVYLAFANFPEDFSRALNKTDSKTVLVYVAMTALTVIASFLIFGGALPREDVFRLIYVPGIVMLFGAVLLNQSFAIFQCFLISSIAVAGFIFSGNAAIKTEITVDMYFLYAYLLIQNGVALWISSGAKEWQGFTDRLKEASNKALIASNQKSQFLANMSHEIRTPLNGIIGLTNLMLEEETANKEKLNLLRRSADSLLQVLNGALDYASIEAGKITLLEKPFDLHQLISDVYYLFKPNAEYKGLKIIYSIEKNVPRFVEADDTRIRQILTNLLSNAMKFTQTGKVELRLDYREEDGAFIFHIIDTGVGIAEEQLIHIFDPFVQGDNSPSRRYEGTGLGLSISRAITERLGGILELDTEYQYGTHVRMELKLAIANEDTVLNIQCSEKTLEELVNELDRNKTILLIEDNTTNALVVEKMLENLGYKVLLAENGECGFDIWLQGWKENKPIDLIIMDCHMPIIDGYEATAMIREKESALGFQAVPIIALTANAQKEEKLRCLKAGMNDYLSKPLYLDDLKRCLWRHARVSSTEHVAFLS